MTWIGYAGLIALALCWIPQSAETVRSGKCGANLKFLLLSALGSFLLMMYALLRDDTVFSILNALTTIGALLNLYYKVYPRTR